MKGRMNQMKRQTLFLIVVLLVLVASSTYASKYYRTDYDRYEETESSSLEYDFSHLRKQFNAADEPGKVAIIKTVFKEGWVLRKYHFNEVYQIFDLIDSRGAFDNGALKERDLLNLSKESRYELLLATKEIVTDDKQWPSSCFYQSSAPERIKLFALWMKNAKSIEKDQELKSIVKGLLSQSTYGQDDLIFSYLAYCSLNDDEFDQITATLVSGLKGGLNYIKSDRAYAKPMESYDVEDLPLILKIAEQKLLPERNMSNLVETLGELFAKIPPFEMEAKLKRVGSPDYYWLGQYEVVGYKPAPLKTNLELAKTLKIVARKYRPLRPQIDEILKKDTTRRNSYDKSLVGGVMWDYSK